MTAVEPQCGVIVGNTRRPCILASGHGGEFHRDALGGTAAIHDATERERRARGQHLQRMREFRVGIPPGQRPVTILLDEFDALLAVAAERDALNREACAMPDEVSPQRRRLEAARPLSRVEEQDALADRGTAATALADDLEPLIWAWFNRHDAPWSPSDAKVRDLAFDLATAAVGRLS